jgi:hypothetical protein
MKKYRHAHPEKIQAIKKKWKRTDVALVGRRAQSKRYRERYTPMIVEKNRRYAEQNPEKIKARREVAKALKSGILKKGECKMEGCDSKKVQAHHHDYSKPLDVEWACSKHHAELDGKVK